MDRQQYYLSGQKCLFDLFRLGLTTFRRIKFNDVLRKSSLPQSSLLHDLCCRRYTRSKIQL